MLTYTTKTAIANRLRGRLTVGGPAVPFQPTTIDDNLIEQVGEQVEARVNARLGTIYQLPLLQSQPLLASIVEKGVICELMGVHFVGQEGTEAGGFGRLMCSQFDQELTALLAGSVTLTGEVAINPAEATKSANLTLARPRTPGAAEAVQW
jgi:hypothetical protein